MRVSIRDKGRLSEVSPAALAAYARASGWTRTDNYGDSSDVYRRTGYRKSSCRGRNDWVIMRTSYHNS